MKQYDRFYINGEWVAPLQSRLQNIINPATEQVTGQLALGSAADVAAAAPGSIIRLDCRDART